MNKRRNTGPTGQDAVNEINLRLGGLLGALGDTISDLAKAAGEGRPGAFYREHDIETPDGPIKARAGVSIRFGGLAGEEPKATPRERTRPAETQAPTSPSPRSPLLEVFEDDAVWRLVAELPGAAEEDLNLHTGENILRIETSGTRMYSAETEIPAGAAIETMEVHFANGILELTHRKS